MSNTISLFRSFLVCTVTYLLAIGAAVGTGFYFKDLSSLEIVAYGDIAGTLVVFILSVIFRNASLYDAYWSVKPPVIALFYLISPENVDINLTRQSLVLILIFAWGLRLTWNWARKWEGLGHQDWRYADLKEKTGKFYFFVNLTGIHFFPTLLVYLSCLPMYPAMSLGNQPLGLFDVLGVVVATMGILFELIADNQLRAFTLNPNRVPGETLKTGLWKYSRHPNYFGEVSFWWGIFLFALPVTGFEWTIIGPVSITLLFVFISIPMIDQRMLKRRANYAEHIKNVSALVPWFPKNPK
ncbi:MAG: DUF1295 domain-containing protein [Cytophagales bacterium]|nr:DUF1295 domain-containing protein [Cytophagales bacterium]